MNEIRELLAARKAELCKIQKNKEQALKTAPKGSLRISGHGDKMQYYHRCDPQNNNGIYLKEKEIRIAKALAQKDYDQKVLQAVEKEMKVIDRFVLHYPQNRAEEIYQDLHMERQKLVCPIRESDEEYVYKWEKIEYMGKTMDDNVSELYTAKGEQVRSKSEEK